MDAIAELICDSGSTVNWDAWMTIVTALAVVVALTVPFAQHMVQVRRERMESLSRAVVRGAVISPHLAELLQRLYRLRNEWKAQDTSAHWLTSNFSIFLAKTKPHRALIGELRQVDVFGADAPKLASLLRLHRNLDVAVEEFVETGRGFSRDLDGRLATALARFNMYIQCVEVAGMTADFHAEGIALQQYINRPWYRSLLD